MIGLFHGGVSSKNGPGKVAMNLMAGLNILGVDFAENEEKEINGCLASWSPRYKDLPRETLVGPNLMTLPSDDPAVWHYFDNFVVPCEWVQNKYEKYTLPSNVKLHQWAVGIDTELFSPTSLGKSKCLIYNKRGSQENLELIINTLDSLKIDYNLLNYGSYSESDLISAIDKPVWNDQPGYNFPATSVPYFDDRCGVKHHNFSMFGEFLDKLSTFKPRDYIMDNLTLEKSGSEYIKLMEISHGCKI
jgi:hypothetical protein